MQVVEALSDLRNSSGGMSSANGLVLLRLLTRDSDAAVQARAAAVEARVVRAMTAAKSARVPTSQTENPPAVKDAPPALGPGDVHKSAPEESTLPADAPTHAAAPGSLLVSAAHPLLFQIDQRGWQRTDGRAVALDAGAHRVLSLSGPQTVEIHSGQVTPLTLTESPAEDAERRGQDALSAQDYRKAQKLFTKGRSACAKEPGTTSGCVQLGFDIAVKLGQVYEAQSRWTEAMTEYQTAAQLAPQVRGQKENKTLAQAGIARLETRLGRVVMSKITKGKCREQSVWMPTGTHTLVIAGSAQTIKVTSGTTVHIGSCK